MLTEVEILTPRVTTSPLPFAPGAITTDPVQIHNIDGLGPVAANINTGQFGTINGEFYNGSYVGKRNIVITFGLNPNWAIQTIESLRMILYTYFMPQNQVTLKFTSTHVVPVEIVGYIETMEPNIFSQNPEMQVSIICPKADFVASSVTIVPGVTLALPDGDPTIIEYLGSSPTGFILDVSATDDAPTMTDGEVRVINENPTEGIFIVTATVDADKFLEVSTIQGNKYVIEIPTPSGSPDSIFGAQSGTWLQLDQGTNKFRVMSDAPGQVWNLKYFERYGGI